MKMEKLEKSFNKIANKEIEGGFATIDRIVIYQKPSNIINIEGKYGSKSSDGKVNWVENFKLKCFRRMSCALVKWLFLHFITNE